jgi:hypothetical protein
MQFEPLSDRSPSGCQFRDLADRLHRRQNADFVPIKTSLIQSHLVNRTCETTARPISAAEPEWLLDGNRLIQQVQTHAHRDWLTIQVDR